MHIKRIVIQGFKTYKNTTIIEDISPEYNVVVGRNGSGKSNFFAAIRFVLSDDYTHMTRSQRQSLIHEGSGTVMSAYVEIVFDNTDRRIQVDQNEVVIRRTVGLKKDDYSLNFKSATRSDVMNLLENAGFSKSNPYYIVPQGRITSLTNAKDSERLKLLKEVAGARVFEQKLKDSIKEMNASQVKREKIDETLVFIEKRLEDLNAEKNELKKYEKLANRKKTLEYNLFDKELTNVDEQIDTIDMLSTTVSEKFQKYSQELDKNEASVKELNETLTNLKNTKKMAILEKQGIESDIKETIKSISQLELDANESKVSIKDSTGQVTSNKQQLVKLRKIIKDKSERKDQIQPELLRIGIEEQKTKIKLNELKKVQTFILSKQSNFSHFKTKEERDSWLNDQIAKCNKDIERNSELLSNLKEELSTKEKELATITDKLSYLENTSIKSSEKSLNEANYALSSIKSESRVLMDERKSLWREQTKLRNLQSTIEDNVTVSQQKVAQTMDRSLAVGLASVKRIANRLGLKGVYGTLGELIEVSHKYRVAAEVVGGNSLFHVVVDNEKTASIIMEELIREKAGRVTFMPLNRLTSKEIAYPNSNECIPLIKKIDFEDALLPAVKQVFGRTVVVLNLEKGVELASQYSIDAITLDGDKCNKKGVFTGGSRDFRSSRIGTLKDLRQAKIELEETESKIDELDEKLTTKETIINDLNLKVSQLHKEYEAKAHSHDDLRKELDDLRTEKLSVQKNLEKIQQKITTSEQSVESTTKELDRFEHELQSTFVQVLTEDEIRKLDLLSSEIPLHESSLTKIVTKLSDLEVQFNKLKSELEMKLLPTFESLEKAVNQSSAIQKDSHLNDAVQDIKQAKKSLHLLEQKQKDLFSKLESYDYDILNKEQELENINNGQRLLVNKLKSFMESSEKKLSRKLLLVNRRDQINKSIRDLGALPEEAFTEYKEYNSSELIGLLNKVNQGLKQFSHINKKAWDQYNSFAKKRDELVQRREELDSAKDSIEDLIQVSEQRKDEAILNTFKKLSEAFAQVFELLVPNGMARLVLEKRESIQEKEHPQSNKMNNPGHFENDGDNEPDIETYSGVSISVSFNSKGDEQQRIEQLSGGQKSLCAIALIFAIQKCDPAPFYLFDEVDANLDTQYRTSVARLINRLSRENAQFICTTFRPEMIQVADKFYGVMFNNKVSEVSEINRNEAMNFIEDQQRV
ncbi:Multiprotein cohesin complex subunit [Komagataella phaffii CBS 7435]|uniref:Structural maintenance of chromosomes protein n=1 Tax=Komagataella phaffii (strain ATCC 76273 / CBS 7435 / CECT 11047 / NRRL Y-11430 / Wegner 21-1) TaxID=981350 RepID=F2QRJ1_KOMPC|nr:GQ67_01021T0 [Komagataella phaffii]CAH2447851.1 Multiprotein cohesin complex subunit [Komagataella phaffii CBS 7435]CCA38019.1 Multiprotein cohesin complex subunit [Komagataella phaffii CBS 7435]